MSRRERQVYGCSAIASGIKSAGQCESGWLFQHSQQQSAHGVSGILLAIAMLFLVAKIPDILARFPSMSIQESQGIGRVIGTMIICARLFVP